MNEQPNVLGVLAMLATGKMTPDDAEKWSKETGEPLPYGRPSSAFYDPMGERNWSPLQALAWIATRDVERVRDVSEGFRRWWTELRERDAESVVAADVHNESVARRVWIRETIGRATFAETAAVCRGAYKARRELWLELENGKISATGFRGVVPDGLTLQGAHLAAIKPPHERSPIPSHAWADLKFPGDSCDASEWRGSAEEAVARACVRADDRYSDAPDRVRTDGGLVYTGVRILRDDVLKLWLPKAPTLTKGRREPGRPPAVRSLIEEKMLTDVASGYDLENATEEELLAKYRTKSRNPVRTARDNVLSKIR